MKIIDFLGCDNIESDNFHIRTVHLDINKVFIHQLMHKWLS